MDEQNKNEVMPAEDQQNITDEEAPIVPDVIFDAGDDETEAALENTESAEEEPVKLTPFQEKVAAIPEKKWKLYQGLGGFLIGALTVFALFYRKDTSSGTMSYGFIIAICLALFGPNYIEKQGKRDIFFGRKVMCITMGVGMVLAVLILGFATNWQIFKPVE